MNTTTITLPANVFYAVAQFAAKNVIRYYLNGVLLQVREKETRICATENHMLAVARAPSEDFTGQEGDFIIPDSAIPKMSKKDDFIRFTISGDTVTVSHFGVTMQGQIVDWRFPEYARVIPAQVSGETAQFQPSFLARIAKAYNILHDNGNDIPTIAHNGLNAALVGMNHSDFVAVIMPIRGNAPAADSAAWARVRVPAPRVAVSEQVAS